jgi:hypothetical protein
VELRVHGKSKGCKTLQLGAINYFNIVNDPFVGVRIDYKKGT